MSRTYHVVDADGHILEPLGLWQAFMDVPSSLSDLAKNQRFLEFNVFHAPLYGIKWPGLI
jgi:hypothetical protein